MRKITFLLILLTISCLAMATEYTANNSAELSGYLTSTVDGDVINLAAGTYYPPEVTMDFTDFWNDGTGATTVSKTFNAFVVPEKDITISGTSTSTVIFDRNTTDENDWQFAFVFFSDGDAADVTGVTFENFTVQNLEYGLVNSWAFTKNYITSPTASYMEYTSISNVDFNDVSQSAIILEPKFYEGSKGSNNTDLFSDVNYDWESLSYYNQGAFSMGSGYPELSSMCEISDCNFNVNGSNPKADNFNKAMVNLVSAVAHISDCRFDSGWRGIHMYAGGAVFTSDVKMHLENNSFNDFDGAEYLGISANVPDPPEEYDQNEEYYQGRCVGIYYQAGTVYGDFYGNYYSASNGAGGIWTDGLASDVSNFETYNYLGSNGWIKDIHNVKSHIVVQNCDFYVFDEGQGIIITKHGDTNRTSYNGNTDGEDYDYDNVYGTLNEPVTIRNCNFYGVNTANPTYPGSGCAIFLADWEHYARDGWGVSDPGRQSEIAMVIEDCMFEGFYAGFFVDGGRPDNVCVPTYKTAASKWSKHDDGRIQLYVTGSKFINCEYSCDFSWWDQWVRTSSFIVLENNYFGADVDPYTTFNFATDFPPEDSYYDLDNSGEWSSDLVTQTGWTYGQGATQRSYSEDPETDDNYHVFKPQFLQYLPYYTDYDMTQLSGVEVENLVITRSGTDLILDWDDNANPDAKYAVYAADDPYTEDWGSAVATVDASTYTYDATGLSEKYFMVALVIPNLCEDGFYGENNIDGYGPSIVYEENDHATHPYSWPEDFTYPIDYYYGDPLAVQSTGTCDIDYYYADDASYAVTKAGFMKKTLTYTSPYYNFISLPFEGNYGTISNLYDYLGLISGDEIIPDDVISAWDETTQAWQSAPLGDEAFVPEVSNSYYITAGSAHDIYMMGSIPDSPTYNLITTTTTDLNFIMIPLDCELATAAELGAEMGHNNAVMISQWNETTQSWQSCVYLETFSAWINSFNINPAMPLMIGAEQNFTWPQ